MIQRFFDSSWAVPTVLVLAALSESIVEWLSRATHFIINLF